MSEAKYESVETLNESENSFRHQFGPTTTGARNWWLITLFLLSIVLLIASLAVFPLSAACLMTILVFKCIALATFGTSIGMAIKAFFDAYYRDPLNQKNSEPYVFFAKKQFLAWMQDPVNKATFFCGLIFFIVVVIALIFAFPGVGVAISLISPAIMGLGTLFAATSTFGGSLVFAAIFLGAVMMTGFDLMCRGLDACFPAPDGDEIRKRLLPDNDCKNNVPLLPVECTTLNQAKHDSPRPPDSDSELTDDSEKDKSKIKFGL